MCKLSYKIKKEAEKHHLCGRLEELYHEYYNWIGSRVSVRLVDLIDWNMYSLKKILLAGQ